MMDIISMKYGLCIDCTTLNGDVNILVWVNKDGNIIYEYWCTVYISKLKCVTMNEIIKDIKLFSM